MSCYIKNIIANDDIHSDIKTLIPEAAIRRRMSRILRMAVSTAVECCNIKGIKDLDCIITATGYGCLADSEKFLRNVIENNEELLNPTPFIQSTFNTVGGQIALLSQNHCENITYVNRSHSFEDALLDSYIQICCNNKKNILLGVFDEITESSNIILERIGIFRNGLRNGEGAIFMEVTSQYTEGCKIQIKNIEFSNKILSRNECLSRYSTSNNSRLIYNEFTEYGIYPTVSARIFYRVVKNIHKSEEVIICNNYPGMNSSIIVVKGV